MKKPVYVKNHKKTERIFKEVSDVAEYLDSLSAFSQRTMFVWKKDGENVTLTYSEFTRLVRRFALGISSLPIANGSEKPYKIAVMGETSPFWLAAYLAIIASGNIAVPMDKELAPEEIAGFCDMVNISSFVCSATYLDEIVGVKEKSTSLKYIIPFNLGGDDIADDRDFVIPYTEVLSRGATTGLPFAPDRDTERCCELLFTSGTTGTSKCVMLCQRNVFFVVSAACRSVDFEPDDVLVSVLPLHHTYELACLMAGCNYGMTVCINDSLRNVLKNFKEFKPTGLVLVPLFVSTMYKKILSEAKRSGKEKIFGVATTVSHYLSYLGVDMSEKVFRDVREAFGGRLKKIICGGAALDPKMIQVFETFGISIYEGYGITECSPLVAVTPYYKRKLGSVGPAVPGCEVRISGLETNERGYVVGEIQVRGNNVMLGYLGNDEANKEAFTDDGWFRTGDIGYMDNAGYVYITGRSKYVIVLDNGKNVFPEEIEEYLGRIDGITEAVVLGEEGKDGVKLVAVVFPNYEKYAGLSENEVREAIKKEITSLNKQLPSFKQIHRIEFRKTEFEKTTSRKIKRHLVKLGE